MPIESAPIVFAATDLEFGCLCYLSLDWAGLLTSDATMTLLDAWAWSEIATISEKGGGGFFHARCTVKLEMVGGRRKNVRLKDAADLRRFFHTVARFTPTEKVGGRRRTLWRQRRALRLLHTPTPNPNPHQGLPNGNGTLPPSSAALARLSPDRAALEVPSSSRGSNSNRSTHQRWPIVEEEEEEENGEVNPGTSSSSFIIRLPRSASRAPSYATLLRKQKQKQNQEEEEEEEEEKLKSSSSSSEGEGISERGKRLSLSTRSVVSTETQTVYPPPPPPPPPPPSLFQTPSYRRPPPLLLKKKGVIVSAQKLAVAVAAPCLLQASLLDELKSNFRSGIFIPPVRPKLPPAIIAAATLARKGATLKRVASTASLPLLSPLSRSISEASKSSSSASSSSFSSTKSVKGGDDDEDDDEAEEEVEDGADDYESQNTGGGNHPLTLFEELQNFIRFGRLRHVEPRVKQVATTTATLFNEDSFRNFRYPLFQRMVSAPALLPSPYFPSRAPARPAAFQVRNARLQEEEKDDEGGSDNSTQLENHHQQEEEEEEKEKKEDIHENNPSPPKQKTFILRPQKTPPPPPPQIIQYHPFSPLENGEVKNVDPDGNNNSNNGNNNGNAQFRACQLTPVPCAEHGTDLVVQQEHQHQQEQQEQHQDQDLITPEKTPFGLITGQPCRRRALSFASGDHQADGGEEEEDNNSSKSENEISSSKEPPLLAPLDRQEN